MSASSEAALVKAEAREVDQPKPSLSLLEASIEQGEKYLKAFDRIRKIAISLTNTSDWIDQNGKPYLESAGCAKIASAFGVRTESVHLEKQNLQDTKGAYVRFRVTGNGVWQNVQAEEVGSASTRDDFFAKRKRDGKEIILPMEEVDLGDVEKKAFTNFMNRLIKRLIGLSFSWEDIATYSGGNVTRDKCSGVSYGKGTKGGSTAPSVSTSATGDRAKAWKQLLDICDGEPERAAAELERLTTWKKDNQAMPGKRDIARVSDAQLRYLSRDVQKLWDEWDKATGGQAQDEPPIPDDPNGG
jgi:hypothetical protein